MKKLFLFSFTVMTFFILEPSLAHVTLPGLADKCRVLATTTQALPAQTYVATPGEACVVETNNLGANKQQPNTGTKAQCLNTAKVNTSLNTSARNAVITINNTIDLSKVFTKWGANSSGLFNNLINFQSTTNCPVFSTVKVNQCPPNYVASSILFGKEMQIAVLFQTNGCYTVNGEQWVETVCKQSYSKDLIKAAKELIAYNNCRAQTEPYAKSAGVPIAYATNNVCWQPCRNLSGMTSGYASKIKAKAAALVSVSQSEFFSTTAINPEQFSNPLKYALQGTSNKLLGDLKTKYGLSGIQNTNAFIQGIPVAFGSSTETWLNANAGLGTTASGQTGISQVGMLDFSLNFWAGLSLSVIGISISNTSPPDIVSNTIAARSTSGYFPINYAGRVVPFGNAKASGVAGVFIPQFNAFIPNSVDVCTLCKTAARINNSSNRRYGISGGTPCQRYNVQYQIVLVPTGRIVPKRITCVPMATYFSG
jgi:hypothetical protein